MAHAIGLRFAILVSLLGVLGGSCSKPKPVDSSQPDAGTDPCALLTKEEVEAVQGEVFKETKPSQKTVAGLTMEQCYFELPTPVNSIVLTVTRKADGGRNPTDSWKEIFHREKSEEREEREEREEEKGALKIPGIGDEAFWTGTRVGGALYVLKDNYYIRVSVGGAEEQGQKIEKTKTLAANVLKRLQER
jgi:hypothetical protein